MKRLIPLFALLPLTLAGAALPDHLGDIAQWKTLDWDHPGTSALWQEKNWVNYIGAPAPGENRQRIQDLRIADVDVFAILARTGAARQPDQLQLLTHANDRRRNQCQALSRWAKARFGVPGLVVDGGYTLTADSNKSTILDLNAQWELGTTRLTLLCQARETAGKTVSEAFSRLVFSSAASTPPLKPLLTVTCTRNEQAGASEPARSLERMAFIVDENRLLIRRPDKAPLKASEVRIENDSVTFSLEKDTASNDYRLDRSSGRLTGTLRLAGIPMIRISGHCQMKPLPSPVLP